MRVVAANGEDCQQDFMGEQGGSAHKFAARSPQSQGGKDSEKHQEQGAGRRESRSSERKAEGQERNKSGGEHHVDVPPKQQGVAHQGSKLGAARDKLRVDENAEGVEEASRTLGHHRDSMGGRLLDVRKSMAERDAAEPEREIRDVDTGNNSFAELRAAVAAACRAAEQAARVAQQHGHVCTVPGGGEESLAHQSEGAADLQGAQLDAGSGEGVATVAHHMGGAAAKGSENSLDSSGCREDCSVESENSTAHLAGDGAAGAVDEWAERGNMFAVLGEEGEGREHSCEVCGEGYNSRTQLFRHLRSTGHGGDEMLREEKQKKHKRSGKQMRRDKRRTEARVAALAAILSRAADGEEMGEPEGVGYEEDSVGNGLGQCGAMGKGWQNEIECGEWAVAGIVIVAWLLAWYEGLWWVAMQQGVGGSVAFRGKRLGGWLWCAVSWLVDGRLWVFVAGLVVLYMGWQVGGAVGVMAAAKVRRRETKKGRRARERWNRVAEAAVQQGWVGREAQLGLQVKRLQGELKEVLGEREQQQQLWREQVQKQERERAELTSQVEELQRQLRRADEAAWVEEQREQRRLEGSEIEDILGSESSEE